MNGTKQKTILENVQIRQIIINKLRFHLKYKSITTISHNCPIIIIKKKIKILHLSKKIFKQFSKEIRIRMIKKINQNKKHKNT